MNTKAYNAGAKTRNAALTVASTITRGTTGAGSAIRDFWNGLTNKTVVHDRAPSRRTSTRTAS